MNSIFFLKIRMITVFFEGSEFYKAMSNVEKDDV